MSIMYFLDDHVDFLAYYVHKSHSILEKIRDTVLKARSALWPLWQHSNHNVIKYKYITIVTSVITVEYAERIYNLFMNIMKLQDPTSIIMLRILMHILIRYNSVTSDNGRRDIDEIVLNEQRA